MHSFNFVFYKGYYVNGFVQVDYKMYSEIILQRRFLLPDKKIRFLCLPDDKKGYFRHSPEYVKFVEMAHEHFSGVEKVEKIKKMKRQNKVKSKGNIVHVDFKNNRDDW